MGSKFAQLAIPLIRCWIGVSLVSGRNLSYRVVFLKIFWHQGYTTTLDPLGAVPVGQNLASLCRIGGLGIGLWPTICLQMKPTSPLPLGN